MENKDKGDVFEDSL